MTDAAKCWKCEGTGVIMHEEGPAGATFSVGNLCPACDGSGKSKHRKTQAWGILYDFATKQLD